jgi:group II intron reverse transcriptase/maturase
LRRTDSGQLAFAFADSPQGGKGARPSDASGGKAFLLHTAKSTKAQEFVAPAADVNRLLEKVASPPNLASALLSVARNKGAPGVDGRSVEEVVGQARRLLFALRRALLEGSYRPGDIRRVWIPKPGGGQRGLGIPNVVDRWVQQAALQVLEPIFDPTFHTSSHGFRRGRGAASAIAEAKEHLGTGCRVVVDIDLSKFFDRVHHQRLLSRLGRRVKDPRTLDLVRRMLKAKVVLPDGMRVSTEEGTPQGGPLSPLLSNVVLDELDRELDRRGLRFVRYADDFQVFVRSERAGRRVMASIRRFLERRLRLSVNEEKSAVARPEDVHFLGFRSVVKDDGAVEVHISKRTKERLDTKIRELTPRSWGQSVKSCMEALNVYLKGWAAYFRLCTAEGAVLFRRFDAHIRRRIRVIILRQKKRPRYLYRHLVACGVKPSTAAATAFQRRGPWNRSNRPGMTMAYRNHWFAERLVSLATEWHRFHAPRRVSGQAMLFDL